MMSEPATRWGERERQRERQRERPREGKRERICTNKSERESV